MLDKLNTQVQEHLWDKLITKKTVRKMISELESATKEETNRKKRKNVLIPEVFLGPTESGSTGKKRRVCLPPK